MYMRLPLACVMLAACSTGLWSRVPGAPAPAGTGVPESNAVFDDARLETYTIVVADEEWRKLQATALDEAYVRATLSVSGEAVGPIGLRYKGAYGTLDTCFDRASGKRLCPKVSFKVKFDRRWRGLRRLNLHALARDPTYLRERLAYKLFREMGVAAPRSVHARVVVNGEYQGIFAVTEQIDGRFVADRWPDAGAGNLYKEAWPAEGARKRYDERLKTNTQAPSHAGLIAFADALAGARDDDLAAAAARFIHLDYFMRVLAVDRALSNWDGFLTFYCDTNGGCANHNFYLYEAPASRFWLIPWDLDNTWSLSTGLDQLPAWTDLDAPCGRASFWTGHVRPPACDKLVRALALAGQDAYGAAVARLLDGPFQTSRLRADLHHFAAQIDAGVREEADAAGHAAWRTAVAQLHDELPLLRQRLEAARAGQDLRALGLVLGRPNDFERLHPLAFAMGAGVLANARSTIGRRLNAERPLAGAADARIEFEYRNSDDDPSKGAWSHWSNLRFGFRGDAVDLRKLRAIKLKVRADSERTIRLDLDSPAAKAGHLGVRHGWDFSAGPAPREITLDAAQLAIPAWAQEPGDLRGEVLEVVNGLIFTAGANGRDDRGLLPPGAADRGFVQLDDILIVVRD